MATKTVNTIPPPSAVLVDIKTGNIDQYWYDFLAGLAGSKRLQDFVDDTAAKAGGIPLNGFYRTGNAVKIRVT